MKKLALMSLEKAINQYLQLDPDTTAKLEALHPKIVAINITDWGITLYCQPTAQGLNLFSHWEDPADTTIRATLPSLIRVGLSHSNNKSLFDNAVTITGNMNLGEQIRDIMRDIDIDWESHLARVVGDSLAVGVMNTAEKLSSFISERKASLHNQVKDYLHHEKALVIQYQDMRHFANEIAILRQDTDRLIQAVARLQPKE